MDWQPIETAPRDRAVLVYSLGYHVAHWNTLVERWIGYGWSTPDTKLFAIAPPTHWCELKPPAGAIPPCLEPVP